MIRPTLSVFITLFLWGGEAAGTMEIPQFSQKAQEELKYYVYCLVDPRDRKIFYVGKGVGNRVFAHAYAELRSEGLVTDKLDKIREIISSGYKVLTIAFVTNLQKRMLLQS